MPRVMLPRAVKVVGPQGRPVPQALPVPRAPCRRRAEAAARAQPALPSKADRCPRAVRAEAARQLLGLALRGATGERAQAVATGVAAAALQARSNPRRALVV